MNIDQWYNSYLQKTHQYTGRALALGSALLTVDVSRPRARWETQSTKLFYMFSCFWSFVKEPLHFHAGCGMHYAHPRFTALLERATEDAVAKISSRFPRAVMHLCISCTLWEAMWLLHMSNTVFPLGLDTDMMESLCYTVHRETTFLPFSPSLPTAGCMPRVYGPCGFTVCSSKF